MGRLTDAVFPIAWAPFEVGDGVDGDVVRVFDVEHRVREAFAKVPPHRLGHDAVKAGGGADIGN